MPTFLFEAMDATGQEIRDEIEASTQEEAQATIRQMGYFVTKISVRRDQAAAKRGPKKRGMSIGGAGLKQMSIFTRQLSILQDAGLPILRSLRILEGQSKGGALKNGLQLTCDEIEQGATLSEAMAKSPKVFNRLYINMVRAGEAGGALEIILRRLAEFLERMREIRTKIIGAMIYPAVVVIVAVLILLFIMLVIVPVFDEMFTDMGVPLPWTTQLLIAISRAVATWWFLIPLIPLSLFLFIKLVRKFKTGRMGWDTFLIKIPVLGKLIEKAIMARTTRTLGTLVGSGVPILEGLTITRETANNAMFERMYGKVTDAIREGDTIARPMKENSVPGFHPISLFFWVVAFSMPPIGLLLCVGVTNLQWFTDMAMWGALITAVFALIGGLIYILRMNGRVVDDLVVNMVDVGEETGELDTMLYKVADMYDQEVKTATDGLMKIIEPLMIVCLGVTVGFIVVALFMPLVEMINTLS